MRFLRGLLLAAAIVTAIFGVLAGADSGISLIGVTKRCDLEFPKWLGCVLENHEGLAGGLIGAGGALFAGWLAWSGALLQIAVAKLPSLLDAHDRTLRQVFALSYARDYVASILTGFKAVSDTGSVELVNELKHLYTEGGLTQPLMPQASRENGLRVEHLVRSLREVASRAGTPQLQADRAAESIRATLCELRRTLEDINKEIKTAQDRALAVEASIKKDVDTAK